MPVMTPKHMKQVMNCAHCPDKVASQKMTTATKQTNKGTPKPKVKMMGDMMK